MRALCHRVRDDTVQAGTGEQQSGRGEYGYQEQVEAPWTQRAGYDLIEGPKLRRNIGIEFAQDLTRHRHHCRWICRGANDNREVIRRLGPLRNIYVDGRRSRTLQAFSVHVSDNSNDGEWPKIAIHVAELNQAAQRVLVGPLLTRERLANQRYMRRVHGVTLVK